VQTNIKRLLGYSSIANVGYALVAVAAGPEHGAAALLIFSTIYAVTTLGLFAGVLAMRRAGGMVEGISDLGGLIRTKPLLTVLLSVLIFSVAGMPPFGGFFGKFEVLQAGLNAQLMPLAILVVISSVISLGYYLKLIKIMWFDQPAERLDPVDVSVMGVVLLSAVIAGVVFMVFISELGTGGWATIAASGLLR
jgi:NADH-quinone oxidoreductase subunit N